MSSNRIQTRKWNPGIHYLTYSKFQKKFIDTHPLSYRLMLSANPIHQKIQVPEHHGLQLQKKKKGKFKPSAQQTQQRRQQNRISWTPNSSKNTKIPTHPSIIEANSTLPRSKIIARQTITARSSDHDTESNPNLRNKREDRGPSILKMEPFVSLQLRD